MSYTITLIGFKKIPNFPIDAQTTYWFYLYLENENREKWYFPIRLIQQNQKRYSHTVTCILGLHQKIQLNYDTYYPYLEPIFYGKLEKEEIPPLELQQLYGYDVKNNKIRLSEFTISKIQYPQVFEYFITQIVGPGLFQITHPDGSYRIRPGADEIVFHNPNIQLTA